jgi:hypothetical protein
MMNTLSKRAIAIAVIGIASIRPFGPAHATVLYDNLSVSSGGSESANTTPFSFDPPISLTFGPLYDSFSTGPSGFSLSQIGLLLTAPVADGGSFTINVLSGQTFPGAAVFAAGTFSDSLLSAALSNFYVNFAPQSLVANRRYWVELSTTGSVEWSFAPNATGTGVVGEFTQDQTGVFCNTVGGSCENSVPPFQMQLSDAQVAAVPEPSSWAMMILGFASLAFAARRRARAADRELLSKATAG